jgi:hypothetical protein
MRVAFLAFMVTVLGPLPVLADQALDPPPETQAEITFNQQTDALLRSGRYADLDKLMNQVQRDFEEGRRDDITLMHLFRGFYDTDPTLEEKFNAWIAAYPQSYAAMEARGIYYRRIAYLARGDKYVNQTPDQQLVIMNVYLKRAMESHVAALKLTSKPILSYFDILSVAKLVGGQQVADQMLAQANQVDPQNFIVRYKYLVMLETRWGGGLQKMQQFRADAQKSGMPIEQLRYFDDCISEEIAWLAQRGRQ